MPTTLIHFGIFLPSGSMQSRIWRFGNNRNYASNTVGIPERFAAGVNEITVALSFFLRCANYCYIVPSDRQCAKLEYGYSDTAEMIRQTASTRGSL